ncbi:hypothetical protein [Taro reovirus 1]|nr:hypothetical protein [Taro reovirus 1]
MEVLTVKINARQREKMEICVMNYTDFKHAIKQIRAKFTGHTLSSATGNHDINKMEISGSCLLIQESNMPQNRVSQEILFKKGVHVCVDSELSKWVNELRAFRTVADQTKVISGFNNYINELRERMVFEGPLENPSFTEEEWDNLLLACFNGGMQPILVKGESSSRKNTKRNQTPETVKPFIKMFQETEDDFDISSIPASKSGNSKASFVQPKINITRSGVRSKAGTVRSARQATATGDRSNITTKSIETVNQSHSDDALTGTQVIAEQERLLKEFADIKSRNTQMRESQKPKYHEMDYMNSKDEEKLDPKDIVSDEVEVKVGNIIDGFDNSNSASKDVEDQENDYQQRSLDPYPSLNSSVIAEVRSDDHQGIPKPNYDAKTAKAIEELIMFDKSITLHRPLLFKPSNDQLSGSSSAEGNRVHPIENCEAISTQSESNEILECDQKVYDYCNMSLGPCIFLDWVEEVASDDEDEGDTRNFLRSGGRVELGMGDKMRVIVSEVGHHVIAIDRTGFVDGRTKYRLTIGRGSPMAVSGVLSDWSKLKANYRSMHTAVGKSCEYFVSRIVAIDSRDLETCLTHVALMMDVKSPLALVLCKSDGEASPNEAIRLKPIVLKHYDFNVPVFECTMVEFSNLADQFRARPGDSDASMSIDTYLRTFVNMFPQMMDSINSNEVLSLKHKVVGSLRHLGYGGMGILLRLGV